MNCHVCEERVEPDRRGRIRYEGTVARRSRVWMWGPFAVHDKCRMDVVSPLDDAKLYEPAWEWR